MRIALKTTCLPLLLIMASCQPAGFYDSHGNYHSSEGGYQGQTARRTNAADDKDATAFAFSKPGFYDGSGAYAGDNGAFGVPEDYLPPKAMCRIWVPDRSLSTQGPAETCREKYHLPEHAYVIYGG